LAEQETVAGVNRCGRRSRRRGMVEHARHKFAPPVEDFKEQPSVRLRRVKRLHEAEIGGEAHLPRVVLRRRVEVHDQRICRVRGISGEVDRPINPLVCPRLPKRRSLRIWPACPNLQPCDCHGCLPKEYSAEDAENTETTEKIKRRAPSVQRVNTRVDCVMFCATHACGFGRRRAIIRAPSGSVGFSLRPYRRGPSTSETQTEAYATTKTGSAACSCAFGGKAASSCH